MNICLVLYLENSLNGVFIINTLDILEEITSEYHIHVAVIRKYLTLPHFVFQDLYFGLTKDWNF